MTPSHDGVDRASMATVSFTIQRTIDAPIEAVFGRLADIAGYGDWMPRKGSLLKKTEQTSSGEPGLGTTYTDHVKIGTSNGEITEFDPPRRIVFHWWDGEPGGKLRAEGWPGYTLVAIDPGATKVTHHPKVTTYGAMQLMTPMIAAMARRERTVVMNALAASFR